MSTDVLAIEVPVFVSDFEFRIEVDVSSKHSNSIFLTTLVSPNRYNSQSSLLGIRGFLKLPLLGYASYKLMYLYVFEQINK